MAVGAFVRHYAMNLLSSRIVSEIVHADDEVESAHKVPRRSYGESHRTMGDAIEALEKRDEILIKLLEKSAI